MKRSPSSWQNVLTRLGFKRTSRRRASAGRHRLGGYSRRSRLEPLEERRLLAVVGFFERQDATEFDCFAHAQASAHAGSNVDGHELLDTDMCLAKADASASAGDDGYWASAQELASANCPTPEEAAFAVAGVNSALNLSAVCGDGATADTGFLPYGDAGATGLFEYLPSPLYPDFQDDYVFHTFLYVATCGGQGGDCDSQIGLNSGDDYWEGVYARDENRALWIEGTVTDDDTDIHLHLTEGGQDMLDPPPEVTPYNNVLYHYLSGDSEQRLVECGSSGGTQVGSGAGNSLWCFASAAWTIAVPQGVTLTGVPGVNEYWQLADDPGPIPTGFDMALGDFNADGLVNSDDFDIWDANEGMSDVAIVFHGDADGDRDVDGDDYDIWLANTSEPIYVVSTPDDDNDGDTSFGNMSLRNALTLAANHAGPDTIVFDKYVFAEEETIELLQSLGSLDVDSDVTILGPGADLLTIDGNADANHQYSVFEIESGTEVTISGLTITGGNAYDGGGIYSGADLLSLEGVTISGNTAEMAGGGIFHNYGGDIEIRDCQIVDNVGLIGGGINVEFSDHALIQSSTIEGNTASAYGGVSIANTDLQVYDSTISDNHATTHYGGGLGLNSCDAEIVGSTIALNDADVHGGGIVTEGQAVSLDIVNSAIEYNTTTTGQGGGIAWRASSGGSLDIVSSTIADNEAYNGGGGIWFDDGKTPTATILNSTISSNTALHNAGGGIYAGSANLSIIQCTVAQNNAIAVNGIGGGMFTGGNYVLAQNSIFFDNYDNNGSEQDDINGKLFYDVYDPSASSRHNLIGVANDLDFGDDDYGNMIGTEHDPLLAPLGDYGGPTWLRTHAPLPGSYAIDAGDNAVAQAYDLDEDQRGEDRIVNWDTVGGDQVDVGAVELAFGEDWS
jgi:hypothetical protein